MTVLNKPGGSGTIGIAYINSHKANGNYVCIQALPLITNTVTSQSEIGLKDVTPLAVLVTEQIIFSVAADSPIKSGKDLAEKLKPIRRASASASPARPAGRAMMPRPGDQGGGRRAEGSEGRVLDSGGEAATALMGGHITVAVTPAG